MMENDIILRNYKLGKEGLGNDTTPKHLNIYQQILKWNKSLFRNIRGVLIKFKHPSENLCTRLYIYMAMEPDRFEPILQILILIRRWKYKDLQLWFLINRSA